MLQSRFSCIEWIDLSKKMERRARRLGEQIEREKKGIRIPTSGSSATITTTKPTALMMSRPHQERAPAPNPPHLVFVCPTCEARTFDYPEELRHHFEQHPIPNPNEGVKTLEEGIAICRDAYRELAEELKGPLVAASGDCANKSESPERYEFRRLDLYNWRFCFESECGTLRLPRDPVGLTYTQELLAQPNESISCPHLESLKSDPKASPGPPERETAYQGSGFKPIEITDQRTIREVKTAVKKAEEDLEVAREVGKPIEEIQGLEKAIQESRAYISNTTFARNIKVVNPGLDQSRNRVWKAVKLVYEKLEPDFPGLVSHLRRSITLSSGGCVYGPVSAPEWTLR
jgi:hypothetical protein